MKPFGENSEKPDLQSDFDIFVTFGPVSMETRIFSNIPYTLQTTPYYCLASCKKSKKSNEGCLRKF